jgi:very-short-patch-repair endonuclease
VQKLSEISRNISPEVRKRISATLKGNKNAAGHVLSLEARQKIGAKHRKLWAQIPLEEKQRRTHAGRKAVCSPSGLEKIIHQYLRKAGMKFQSQKSFRPYFVDIFIPKLNLIVECDGEYWHGPAEARRSDRKRDRYLISRYGVRVVRVPEKSIRENPKLVVSTILGGLRST